MILGELLEGLEFDCDYETCECDVISWYHDHIQDEYPLMTDEDIEGFIEVSMECESVSFTQRMYHYNSRIYQELEDNFREKYPEYCI